jgi:cytochrome P450
MNEMKEYFVPLAAERRTEPREDLLTGLVQARHEGSKLDDDEMLSMLVLILVAGNETTTTLIGNAAITLMEHPEAMEQLRAEPELMSSAIDEVLRFSAPIQFDPRMVTRDIELGGAKLKEGQRILAWLGSANRDEKVFENADVFDITRKKNAHLSFGFGTHYCLGANLARLEASVAIETLLRKTKSFRRVSEEPLPLHTSPVFRSFSSIPIRIEGA